MNRDGLTGGLADAVSPLGLCRSARKCSALTHATSALCRGEHDSLKKTNQPVTKETQVQTGTWRLSRVKATYRRYWCLCEVMVVTKHGPGLCVETGPLVLLVLGCDPGQAHWGCLWPRRNSASQRAARPFPCKHRIPKKWVSVKRCVYKCTLLSESLGAEK